jgi:hypothetical protein
MPGECTPVVIRIFMASDNENKKIIQFVTIVDFLKLFMSTNLVGKRSTTFVRLRSRTIDSMRS